VGNGRVGIVGWRPARRNKIKRSYYIDADLLVRLQAFADTLDPKSTDTAIIEAALRMYLDAKGKKK
jgi:hypothetical protein